VPLLILDQKSKKSNNFAWRGLEPTTMRSRAERSNHLGQLSHSKRSDDIMHEKKVYLLPHFLSLIAISHTTTCTSMRAKQASPFHSTPAALHARQQGVALPQQRRRRRRLPHHPRSWHEPQGAGADEGSRRRTMPSARLCACQAGRAKKGWTPP